jgi:hypothetical protein
MVIYKVIRKGIKFPKGEDAGFLGRDIRGLLNKLTRRKDLTQGEENKQEIP